MTSSLGSIRISLRMWFADQFRATMTGFTSRAMNISGGASSRAALSATETEMFFGTISPKVTCRKVTTSSATANATTSAISIGMPTASSGHRHQVVDGGLRDLQDQQRTDRDAQLGTGQHQRDVFHGPQGGLGPLGPGLGERLDLAPPRGHHRELGGHEEGVADQQDDEPENSCPVAHAAPALPVGVRPRRWTRTGLKQIRSIRRPSMRVTLRVPPPTSTVSPTAAMRPSSLMT